MAITFRPAWMRRDATIESDARAFWARLNLLPPTSGVETRLGELCAAAYDGHEMVAVSTAVIQEVEFVRCRIAMFRCAVDPDARRMRVATQITVYSRKLLELWSMENPDTQLMGMGTVVQSPDLLDRDNRRMMMRSTHLGLVGYTPTNEPIRIAWFEHATIADAPPVFGRNR